MASYRNTDTASPAARNGAMYAGLPLGSGAPPAASAGNAAIPYTDALAAQLGSGAAPTNGVSWLGHVVCDASDVCLSSGPPPGASISNGAASAELLLLPPLAHRRSGVAEQELLSAGGAVSYIIDISQGPTATEQDGGYGYGIAQVFPDGNRGDGVTVTAGAFTERVRRGLPALGLAAASLAVAGLTAGVAATPATAFGLLATLLGGLSLATIRVLRA